MLKAASIEVINQEAAIFYHIQSLGDKGATIVELAKSLKIENQSVARALCNLLKMGELRREEVEPGRPKAGFRHFVDSSNLENPVRIVNLFKLPHLRIPDWCVFGPKTLILDLLSSKPEKQFTARDVIATIGVIPEELKKALRCLRRSPDVLSTYLSPLFSFQWNPDARIVRYNPDLKAFRDCLIYSKREVNFKKLLNFCGENLSSRDLIFMLVGLVRLGAITYRYNENTKNLLLSAKKETLK
ncbi:hypothetical protein HOB30_01770 [Candidatus Falkowbacteria bacterium]|nr:hypothetical protein [Candidatus Falkowbacteria bacterium]